MAAYIAQGLSRGLHVTEYGRQTGNPAHGHCRFEWYSAFTIQGSAEAPLQPVGRVRRGQFILTYRKGKGRLIDKRRFEHRRTALEGRRVSDDLHEQPARLAQGRLRLRQITRSCTEGYQMRSIAGRRELRGIEMDYRMFDRWRWEKQFGRVRAEFLLDALVDERIEPGPTHQPRWRATQAGQAQPRRTRAGSRSSSENAGGSQHALIPGLRERTVGKLATERQHPSGVIQMLACQAAGVTVP